MKTSIKLADVFKIALLLAAIAAYIGTIAIHVMS